MLKVVIVGVIVDLRWYRIWYRIVGNWCQFL